MDKASRATLFSCVLFTLFISSYAQQNCSTFTFDNNKQYKTCMILPVLNSSIHWSYHPSNNTVDLAFRRTQTRRSRWVAWALNPSGQRMVGSQCLVAYQNSTGAIRAYTSPINTAAPRLEEGSLSFQVPSISATLLGDEMAIYATLRLTADLLSTNQIWQEGPMNGGFPSPHAMNGDNIRSMATIDFTRGQSV